MNLPFGVDTSASRAEQLTRAINRLIQELVVRCTKSQEEGVREYFDVGVFGYGSEQFGPALGGTLEGKPLVSIREIAEYPLRIVTTLQSIPDGEGGFMEAKVRHPLWFELDAEGKTPMCEALKSARSILEDWIAAHRSSFPPLVFNITDGEATDGDPRDPADALRNLATDDGNVLLFNVHISASTDSPVLYPATSDVLADEFAAQLFEMSSELPPTFQHKFQNEGFPVEDRSRAFVFNGGIADVIQCLDIGTRLKLQR